MKFQKLVVTQPNIIVRRAFTFALLDNYIKYKKGIYADEKII